MSVRTATIFVLALSSGCATGCATKAMREQAGALAAASERLEAETAEFTAARTAVVQLRQRSLVQRMQEVAEQGQYNARTLAQWKVGGTEDRARRVALFDGIVDASEAMYEVRDQGLLWEESVLYSRSALAIDRAALHRLVRHLVSLSRPTRFIDGVRFYVEYGAQVGAQVDADLAEVKAAVAAAKEAARPPAKQIGPITGPGGDPSTDPNRPVGPGDPKDPKDPRDPKDPPPTGPPGPDTIGPGPTRRDPITGITTPVTPPKP